jgi:putative oxidoreductase
MTQNSRLARTLFILRISVFVVMFMWALDKLVNPQHAAGVYEHFYGLTAFSGTLMRTLGLAEIAFLGAFVTGLWKRWTYGGVLLLHAVSTLSSYHQYLTPWESSHLLFFAAWPMLAACYALYTLRDSDVLFTVRG